MSLGLMMAPTEQGFTGHRQMDALGVVHMKGRIYDPTIGRFLQADPFIQAPKNSQNYNRYSYVLNNPMSYSDPSGYFFKAVFNTIKKYWRVIAAAIVTYVTAGAASGWAAGWGYATGTVANGAIAGAIAGAAGGFVATGSLKGALVGALSGAAFGAIGASFDAKSGFWEANGAGHIGSHALAGGIMSDLQGGKFGHGFFSAGLTKSVNVNGMIDSFGAAYDAARIAMAAVIGGTISSITGGKFGNGAVTAGFVQMLNANSQIKGARNNPMGHQRPGSIPIQGLDGKWHWADPQVHAKNFGSDYLATQTGEVMSDYVHTTKEEVAKAGGYIGGALAAAGSGGTAAVGVLILGGSAVLDPTPQNVIGAVTGPLGRMIRPLDDFFYPGGAPLEQIIKNVGHVNNAVTVVCDIPLRC